MAKPYEPYEGMIESVRRVNNFPDSKKVSQTPVETDLSVKFKVKELRVHSSYYDVMKNAQGIFYDEDGDDMYWDSYHVVRDDSVEDIKFIFEDLEKEK